MIDIYGFVISEKIIYSLITLVAYYLIYRLLLRAINKSFALRMKLSKVDVRRQKTTNVLINNIIKYAFGIFALVTILGVMGVNATAIIASVGVMGIAIGLAVQDTLKDVLAGFFIIFENQYAIGDIVMIGTFKGEVTFLGLKTTKLRSETGEIKILSNRNITEITNYSLNRSTMYIDIDLAYDNDQKLVDTALTELAERLTKSSKGTKANVVYLGVQKIGDKITYRLAIDTDAKNQNEVNHNVWVELKNTLDKKEIRR